MGVWVVWSVLTLRYLPSGETRARAVVLVVVAALASGLVLGFSLERGRAAGCLLGTGPQPEYCSTGEFGSLAMYLHTLAVGALLGALTIAAWVVRERARNP